MDASDQAVQLCALTRAFYERTHESFSATRQSAWHGWDELWGAVGAALDARAIDAGRMRIGDVACGNLRFVRFLQQKTKAPLEVYAFDACEPLLCEGLRVFSGVEEGQPVVHEKMCDIAAALLLQECDFMDDMPACDLTVAFGFMHHVPLQEQRERLLRMMADHTADGGFLAVSFWRFADDTRLREKAEAATRRAQEAAVVGELAPGDYLLGWQDDTEAFRFCHHFAEDEIDELSARLANAATEVARFSADGKSGTLNRYAVWRCHG